MHTVSMGLDKMPDGKLVSTFTTVIRSLTNNPKAPAPSPPLSEMQQIRDELQQAMAEAARLRAQSKAATARLNAMRKKAKTAMSNQANYVETISKNNTEVIYSCGMRRRKPNTKPVLIPALNLVAKPGRYPGSMEVRWSSQRGACGWNLEYALVTNNVVVGPWKSKPCSNTHPTLNDLEPGAAYALTTQPLGHGNVIGPKSVMTTGRCLA